MQALLRDARLFTSRWPQLVSTVRVSTVLDYHLSLCQAARDQLVLDTARDRGQDKGPSPGAISLQPSTLRTAYFLVLHSLGRQPLSAVHQQARRVRSPRLGAHYLRPRLFWTPPNTVHHGTPSLVFSNTDPQSHTTFVGQARLAEGISPNIDLRKKLVSRYRHHHTPRPSPF